MSKANEPGKSQRLAPPSGLNAFRLRVDGEEFAILEWPIAQASLARLTQAEREVVALAARGLTNDEIGRERGRSSRTVANQLAMAFAKLGVRSRLELFALLAGPGNAGSA